MEEKFRADGAEASVGRTHRQVCCGMLWGIENEPQVANLIAATVV